MPRRLHALAVTLAAAVLCLTIAGSAFAGDERGRAREHYDRAIELLKQSEYQKALEELKTAYDLHPHYAVLYNLGMTYAALDKPLEAADHLERYLREGGTALAEDRRAETERTLAAQTRKLGRLELGVEPVGARVTVDGVARGSAPLSGPVRVLPGKRSVVVELEGYRSEKRTVDASAGQLLPVPIALTKPEARPAVAPLEIDCPIPDVQIWVDGQQRASTPVGALLVAVGARQVELRRPGYAPSKHSVLAVRGGRATVRCQMQSRTGSARQRFATLELSTGGVEADEVLLDGHPLAADRRVPPGKHRLEVRAAGYRTWSRELTVAPGESRKILARLELTADAISARKAQRTWAWALGIQGGALLVTSGALYLWNDDRYTTWRDRQSQLDDDWENPPADSTYLVRRQTQNDELIKSVHQFDNLTAGLAVAGAASIGVGTVLFLTGESPPDPGGADVALSPEGASARWRVAW